MNGLLLNSEYVNMSLHFLSIKVPKWRRVNCLNVLFVELYSEQNLN
jgi:hypothetical protein